MAAMRKFCTFVGGVASPLLANIMLDDLDKELERRGLPLVRYADDFAIFAKSKRSAKRIMASVTRYLTDELRLAVNQEKRRVASLRARNSNSLDSRFVNREQRSTWHRSPSTDSSVASVCAIGNNGVALASVGENSYGSAFHVVKRSVMLVAARAIGTWRKRLPVAWD